MPRVSRLQTGFETAKESLSELEADATARLEAVDEKLSEWTCYYCMGSEGPLTASNSNVIVCGHGFHSVCAIQARNVAFRAFQDALSFEIDADVDPPPSEVIYGIRCGMCRYKFVGNDGIDIGLAAYPRLIGKCKMPSTVKGIPGAIRARRQELEYGLARLEVAEKIISHEYNQNNLPPQTSTTSGCSIM
jgi:hypothetical protein